MIIVKVPALLGESPVEHPTAARAERAEDGSLLLRASEGDAVVGEYGPGRWNSWRVSVEPSRTEKELTARVAELEAKLLETDYADAEVGEVELVSLEEGYVRLGPASRVHLTGPEQVYEVRSLSTFDSWREATVELRLVDEDADTTEAPAEDEVETR